MTQLISQFAQFFPEINSVFNIGLMILMRLVGLMRLAPVFSRTEIPRQVRISFAVIFTIIVIGLLKPQPIPSDCPLLFCMFINFCVGFMIGFVANTIFMAIFAAGDIINTQMGLQSATQMDPSQHTQTTIMSRYFTFLGVLIFIYSGGIYWLLNSFIKSFEYFPMYSTNFHFEKVFNIQLLVDITSNIMFVGM
ncbi:flagellar biosynthetic protein FliR, partial [bacterium]|nr:flagellar biosynthetic protein FliR [bacterium]